MTIDEAIKHAEEVAEEKERKERSTGCFHDKESSIYRKECIKCAEEHRQLAEWLKELKAHREAWVKLREEMDRLDPDYDSYSVKNNACLLVDICRPKEGDAE